VLSKTIAILALAIGAPLYAQVSAAISGRVTDPSGAAISGATVTVKSLETGASRTVTTNDSGDYTVVGLPLGQQEVKVEKPNFISGRTGVTLVVGQEAVLNLYLTIGELPERVVVTDETPLVNTTTADVSGVVGEKQIKDLPLNGRSFDELNTLKPGAEN
jgi:hypothetical protein